MTARRLQQRLDLLGQFASRAPTRAAVGSADYDTHRAQAAKMVVSGAAAEAIRRILIENARRKGRQKQAIRLNPQLMSAPDVELPPPFPPAKLDPVLPPADATKPGNA